MRIEKLKKSYLTRNIIIGVIVIAIITTLILNFTRARYRTTQSIPLVNGTITFNNADLNVIAMYQESDAGTYEEIDIMPSSGYAINEEESYCNVNGEKDENAILYTNTSIEHVIGNLQKGSKCYLYFDIYTIPASEVILADKTIQERTSFSSVLTTITNGTIYQALDGNGISYYFAGVNSENWLSFAGFYWRIIRINGDGTIRIIYNGTSTSTTGNNTQLSSTSAFNTTRTDNMYVGYMYTSGEVHGLGTSSTIKGAVDTWYQNNIANNTEYASKISTTTGFCGDRSPSTSDSASNGYGGTVATTTYYGAFIRLYSEWSSSNASPSYDCPNDSDLYTVAGSGIGNEALTNPAGLITADEVAYAGGVYGSNNTSYYLYTNQYYWTMSPYSFYYGYAGVFLVSSPGSLYSNGYVNNTYGVRPVINLRSDVVLTGTGSSSDPFVVN